MNVSVNSRKTGAALTLALALLSSAGHSMAQTTADEVKGFVQSVYIEGVPYERASKLDPGVALPVLEQILADSTQQDHWANAAVTIGMIGDERSADLLINFITRTESGRKLSRAQTVAKTSAVMSLGYVVNKTGSRQALDFLKAGTDPRAWDRRQLRWVGDYQRNAIERNQQLAAMSVLGLGLSANAEATQFLRQLQAVPVTPRSRALKQSLPGVDGLVDDALKASSEISNEGLDRYYLRVQPRATISSDGPGPRAEMEMLRAPVEGQILKPLTAGEMLREPQPGQQLVAPKPGSVLRPLTAGEVIAPPK